MIKDAEGLADLEWRGWLVGGHQWAQEPVEDLAVEHGEALPIVGEDVGVGMLQSDDQPFQAQSSQVVAAAARL